MAVPLASPAAAPNTTHASHWSFGDCDFTGKHTVDTSPQSVLAETYGDVSCNSVLVRLQYSSGTNNYFTSWYTGGTYISTGWRSGYGVASYHQGCVFSCSGSKTLS
jgi:hypothetical protein